MSAGTGVSGDKPVGASLGWRLVGSRRAFGCPWFDLRSDEVVFPTGETGWYSYVEHPGSVFVVPVLCDGRVVLARSYRYPVDRVCWEVPAGQLGGDGDAEATARAELREELGAVCERLELVGQLCLANGFARCEAWFYIAHGVSLIERAATEPGEQILEVAAVGIREAIGRVTEGGQDGESALAVLLAAGRLGGGRE